MDVKSLAVVVFIRLTLLGFFTTYFLQPLLGNDVQEIAAASVFICQNYD